MNLISGYSPLTLPRSWSVEDAVAPDAKDLARAQVVEEIQAGGYGNREIVVRHVTLGRTCRS